MSCFFTFRSKLDLSLLCGKLLHSRPTLCNPVDCSPPGSSVHGILQTRILEWVAMPSSRGFAWCRDRAHVTYFSCIGWQVLYHWHHLGSPDLCFIYGDIHFFMSMKLSELSFIVKKRVFSMILHWHFIINHVSWIFFLHW